MQRHETNFVNHNELHFFQCAEIVVQRTFVVFLQQVIGKGRRRIKADTPPFLASFQGNGCGKMCFAGTNSAHKNEILLGRKKLQFLHVLGSQAAGQLNGGSPHKVIQRFQNTETGGFHHAVNPVGFTLFQLQLQQVGHILLCTFKLDGAPFLGHAAQLHLSHHQLNFLRHSRHLPSGRHRRKGWDCSLAPENRAASADQVGIPSLQSCNSTAGGCPHPCGHSRRRAPVHRRTRRHCRQRQFH